MRIIILLYILGLNIPQVTGEGNSTQMHYAKLTIEKSAIDNITELLRPFVTNTALRVDELKKTTTCQNLSSESKVKCTCEPSFKWSDELCQSKPECCSGTCTFDLSSSQTCVSTTSVSVVGNLSLGGEHYGCLAEKSSDAFKKCNDNLLKRMKSVFSTLYGFDHLEIKKYSIGSIIVEFEINIASGIDPNDLISKIQFLSKNLTATAILETEGVVRLSMPTNPVKYESIHNLECSTGENLNTTPTWQLKRLDGVFDITNGTESELTVGPLKTNVALKNASELWAGNYTCLYNQTGTLYTILHKAKAELDVCLLSNIEITTNPGFPRCLTNTDVLSVRVLCEIKNSSENYTVKWDKQNNETGITEIPRDTISGGVRTYTAETPVRCNADSSTPQVICTFTNRCQQQRNASTFINIIKVGDAFCSAEGDWGDTKAGSTAVLKCKNEAGKRQRLCNKDGKWEDEVSSCVNKEVENVLQKALIVDIGLGTLDGNAAHVFSLLENVTNNTENLKTFANMDASVQVLLTLSTKSALRPNQSATDDFLESSSNLLNKSLSNSWKPETEEGNISLPQTYLSSVEQIIRKANITGALTKTNLAVVSDPCPPGNCTTKVFNVNVSLSADLGSIKTAGFKELANYLPIKKDNYTPNSIVVSATTEKNQSKSPLEIRITFPLLKPRPRNVKIKCVYWDNTTNQWSSKGCKWAGPYDEGVCICDHLSSFAILMSRYPIDIPGITVVTYVGLGVSVVSLIISLVIEMIVWSTVVKTNTLHLRHTAHVNISVCLLVADSCFLASSEPEFIAEIWCKTFALLKHFCYLSMFFWMLCLSTTLLHQAVFLFHSVSKKIYLRFSLILGYVCPLIIVVSTFLASKGGAEGAYFSKETCWLVYSGLLEGSIHTFVIPVGIIVIINVFSMVVVIMKLLDHPKNAEANLDKEKKAAVTVMRSVILLTPVFGVTWAFGFAVMLLDLTSGPLVFVVNYVFTLLNAFQGLFILLTTCLGDKLTREALLNYLRAKAPASTTDSTSKLDSSLKK